VDTISSQMKSSAVPGLPGLEYVKGYFYRDQFFVKPVYTQSQGWVILTHGKIWPLLKLLAAIHLGEPWDEEKHEAWFKDGFAFNAQLINVGVKKKND